LRIPMTSDIGDVDETIMGLDLKPSTLEAFKLFKLNRPQLIYGKYPYNYLQINSHNSEDFIVSVLT